MIRFYFNRKEDAPLVWSVDDGDQANEVNVREVCFMGIDRAVTCYEPANKYPAPTGWLEVDGELSIIGDVAFIHGTKKDYEAPLRFKNPSR